MKTLLKKLCNFNNSNNNINRTNDLIPKGIKSTIKSNNHGSSDDYNESWKHIYSQRRNLALAEKEYKKLKNGK